MYVCKGEEGGCQLGAVKCSVTGVSEEEKDNLVVVKELSGCKNRGVCSACVLCVCRSHIRATCVFVGRVD